MPNRIYSWLAPLVICAVFAGALLPSLGRLEFFDGVEHFNLATVQEMRRNEATGKPVNWMLPTLQGDARVVKPPLTAWITALLITPNRAAALATPDDVRRAEAWEQFVFLARLPTLTCSCLLLLGVYVLGRTLGTGDWRVGATAALICAGTVLFFQQSRRSTTDLQLALWVTWTNAMLAVAIVTPKKWLGWCGAGLALGLASMAKGPHIAILMTLVPVAVYALLNRTVPSRLLPPVIGLLIAAIVGLWWYGYVLATVPGIGDIWWREATRKNALVGRAALMPADPWYDYIMILVVLLPWTPWIILSSVWVTLSVLGKALLPLPVLRGRAGEGASGEDRRQNVARDFEGGLEELGKSSAFDVRPPPQSSHVAPGEGAMQHSAFRRFLISRYQLSWLHDSSAQLLSLLWLLLPILVMSFFAEKKERYLLPFVGPAAVLAGWAIVRWWDARRSDEVPWSDRIATVVMLFASVIAAGWLSVAIVVGGTLGMKGYLTYDNQPWYDRQFGLLVGGSIVLLLLMGLLRARKNILSPLLAITMAAWLGGEMKLRGQCISPGDPDDQPQRQLAATIWHRWPTAHLYCAEPVTLYGQLNRPAIVVGMELSRVIDTRPDKLPETPGKEPLILITDRVDEVPPVPKGWKREVLVPLRKGTRYVDVLAKPE